MHCGMIPWWHDLKKQGVQWHDVVSSTKIARWVWWATGPLLTRKKQEACFAQLVEELLAAI